MAELASAATPGGSVRLKTAIAGVPISSTSYEDFRFWSAELASFSAVAAFRTSTYAVGPAGGEAAPAAGAPGS